ncbi:MAG: serine/threonine protein kinase [Planctomycetaceae bacterium]|nr:serine/threonine protein kinase [Planctomycetaceae bacterium]
MALIEGLIERQKRGEAIDVEATCVAHPALAVELRQLWATVQLADNLAELSIESQQADRLRSQTRQSPLERFLAAGSLSQVPRSLGDYELLDELGRGGMGIVFRARQTSLGRVVALKMLLRGELASGQEMARLRAEAESAARLSHPHIVPVYEVGEFDGQPFFSMKFIEGTTLARRLAEGPLPPREAAQLLAPVCRAVAEAHRHGLLHRDLKPSNILIDEEGRPYVSDFGLVKRVVPKDSAEQEAAASLTQSGAILGTPAYMAPEQAVGRRGEVTAATDVYALGAILYAMLTGRPPFQAASALDTVLLVLEQNPVPPRVINPKADPDLEMIALKCLQKPIDLRYASASDLAADLEAYLANEPISARSSHLAQVISRAFRDTHHAPVLENWGVLWMWHSLVVLGICLVTNVLQFRDVAQRWPYVALWVVALGVWAATFWRLRHVSGPVTFVERQIAHVWAGAMVSSSLLFAVEAILGLPVLTLSPVISLISSMVFIVKAGILSGAFYIQAFALAANGLAMAALQQSSLPNVGLSLYGIVAGLCFFIPGWKHVRQRGRR